MSYSYVLDMDREIGEVLANAAKHSKDILRQDHWCGWILSNATVTAEWIFLQQCLGRQINSIERDGFLHHFLSTQRKNGSWGIVSQTTSQGNISATVEAYLAMRILGIPCHDECMVRAKNFILSKGGVAKVRMLTRFYLAMFGLLPWAAVPQMPPEIIYLPAWFPINVYKFASWARCNIVPMTIIRVHEPIFGLPNGRKSDNDFLDELWQDPAEKTLKYTKPYLHIAVTKPSALLFQLADWFLWLLSITLGLWFFRRRAVKKSIAWILSHQEPSGDWAGIYPPMHLNILSLLLENYPQKHPAIESGYKACQRFLCDDPDYGRWMQASVSPVWDTFLMVRALVDAGVIHDEELLARPVAWLMDQQIKDEKIGDWQVYRPRLPAGGFAFEYHNKWYPDVDDTAVGIVALLRLDESLANHPGILSAAVWVLGMQNKDAGWAAFDADNDAQFLNNMPFSDMDSLCDPSTPDVTGHVLETFGFLFKLQRENKIKNPDVAAFLNHAHKPCVRAVAYLARVRETFGGFYGRWAVNYIFGTSAVLSGLVYFVDWDPSVPEMCAAGVRWLRSRQNPDGGWGETVESYEDKRFAGVGESTPSQTAWALMGLMEFLDASDPAVQAGVACLLGMHRTHKGPDGGVAGTWPEEDYTATGFPGHFYLKYELYSHYFPMMALGRYRSLARIN